MAKKRASSVSVRPPLKKKKVSVEGGPSGARSVVHVLAVSHRDMIESCMWVLCLSSVHVDVSSICISLSGEHHRSSSLMRTPHPLMKKGLMLC